MAKNKNSRIAACLMAIVLIVTSMCCMGTVAASAAGTYGTTIYLQTDDTTNPYLHYWVNGNASQSSTWPGVAMTKVTGESNVYSYDLPCDVGVLDGVIFMNGAGNKMTGDVTDMSGNLYTLKGGSGTWSMYDTSTLKLALSTDVESPQYKETAILLSAVSAGGQGAVTYTFKVGSDVVYTGPNSTYKWTPQNAGTYTLTVSAKDTAGNENTKSLSYEIKDDANAEEPIIKSISTGYEGNVPVNTSVPVNVKASGGHVGTNLLFYKVAITDPSGNPVNTVYYKQDNVLSFSTNQKGDYKVDVSVQNSYNKTVQKTYTVTAGDVTPVDVPPEIASFTANPQTVKVGTAVSLSTVVKDGTGKADFTYKYTVNNSVIGTQTSASRTNTVSWTPDKAGTFTVKVTVTDAKGLTATKSISYVVSEKPTDPPTEPSEPTDPPTPFTLGDIDGNGKVEAKDAVYALRHIAGQDGAVFAPDSKQFKAADIDGNGVINLVDAVKILQMTMQ